MDATLQFSCGAGFLSANKTIKLKLAAPEYRDDPWKMFGQLRDLGPVIPIKLPFMGKGWGATTYESVNEVFRDTERFVRDPKNAGRNNLIPMQWLLPRVFFSLIHNMLGADGQRHRRLRSVVEQAFARRNIEGMSEQIETIALNQVEHVAKVSGQNGEVDLMEHFARSFPLTVICELLGLPLEDRARFRKWFAPFSTVSSVFGIFKIGSGMRKVVRYLKAQIEDVRQNPRDGLVSELVQAEHEGQQLNEQELLSMVFLLLVAGHETTVHLISNTLLTLLQFPDAKQELLEDWGKSEAVIEEVLRYSSPVQMGKPRYVAHDMEFHGQPLKRGELITPLIAAANCDPARFKNPNQFDIHRERIYHMTFGSGPHVCLGIKLARTETHFAIKSLFERWPDLRPGFDLRKPDWSKRIGTRGLRSFPVRLS